MFRSPSIVVVTRETRLKGLAARWGTASAAKFRLGMVHQHAETASASRPAMRGTSVQRSVVKQDADFEEYVLEDRVYQNSLEQLRNELDVGHPLTFIDRAYLPTYDFRGCPAVVVIG